MQTSRRRIQCCDRPVWSITGSYWPVSYAASPVLQAGHATGTLCAGEATRLQQYELQVLGNSSTGYQPSAVPSQSSASVGASGDLQSSAQQPGFNWGWR